jgi:hypothetical protein
VHVLPYINERPHTWQSNDSVAPQHQQALAVGESITCRKLYSCMGQNGHSHTCSTAKTSPHATLHRMSLPEHAH